MAESHGKKQIPINSGVFPPPAGAMRHWVVNGKVPWMTISYQQNKIHLHIKEANIRALGNYSLTNTGIARGLRDQER